MESLIALWVLSKEDLDFGTCGTPPWMPDLTCNAGFTLHMCTHTHRHTGYSHDQVFHHLPQLLYRACPSLDSDPVHTHTSTIHHNLQGDLTHNKTKQNEKREKKGE